MKLTSAPGNYRYQWQPGELIIPRGAHPAISVLLQAMMQYHGWIAAVVKVLEEFSPQEFQERVWRRGDGPEVSSYEEAINRFLMIMVQIN